MKQNIWESEYKSVDNLWGLTPNNVLTRYVDLLPENGKVLDLGIGEGRNALYFAKKGFEVHGIDISETAINRCKKLSETYGLQIDVNVKDILSHDISIESYDLIIISNVLNFFSPKNILEIVQKVKLGLKENGMVYMCVFDNEEPGKEIAKERREKIDENTYFDLKTNTYYHYFTQYELKKLLREFQIISFSNSYSLDTSHGKPHYHSSLEILSKK